MTLVEMLLVMGLSALMAAVMIPAVEHSLRSRANAACATKMRTAVQAFQLYATETGGYPPDQNVPGEQTVPKMENYYFPYFKIDWWGDETELGGRWDWDAGYHGFAGSVSICQPTVSEAQMQEFDRLIDDGNLAGGRFIKVDSQYHYILEE
jgi:type II secretory pathway pseudopilin PulG